MKIVLVLFVSIIIGCLMGHLFVDSTWHLGRAFFTNIDAEFNTYCYKGQVLELEKEIEKRTINNYPNVEYTEYLKRVLVQTKIKWSANTTEFDFYKYAILSEGIN